VTTQQAVARDGLQPRENGDVGHTMMKSRNHIMCVMALCLSPLLASAETNLTVTATNVLTPLRQINQHEGKYFLHVRQILESTNGVPDLIVQSSSTDQEVSSLASSILRMIAAPSWEKDRTSTNDWSKWWQETGSKKPVKELWHNFDSYHK
jgi:hypothetical protein